MDRVYRAQLQTRKSLEVAGKRINGRAAHAMTSNRRIRVAYSMRVESRGVGGGGAAARGSLRFGVFPGTVGDKGEEGARKAASSFVFCGEAATCTGSCTRGGGELEISLSVLMRINYSRCQ
jgi:hypothetical protein